MAAIPGYINCRVQITTPAVPRNRHAEARETILRPYTAAREIIQATRQWPDRQSKDVMSFEASGLAWHVFLRNIEGRIYLYLSHSGNGSNRPWVSKPFQIGALTAGGFTVTASEGQYLTWRNGVCRDMPKVTLIKGGGPGK